MKFKKPKIFLFKNCKNIENVEMISTFKNDITISQLYNEYARLETNDEDSIGCLISTRVDLLLSRDLFIKNN